MLSIKLLIYALFSFSSGGVLFSFLSKNWYFIRFCVLYAGVFIVGHLLGNKYILFFLYASVCIYVSKKQPENILYYYVVLLSAFPIAVEWLISLPGISTLFIANHSRVLVLFLFLPIFIRKISSEGKMFDSSSSYTGKIVRDGMHRIIDIWIPYFVISRSIKNVNSVLVVLLFTATVISIMAIIESALFIRLYDSMTGAMGNHYLSRHFRGGSLRVFVSMGHPLALGFFLSLSFVIAVRIRALISCPSYTPWLLAIIIVLGVSASGSRSPLGTCVVGWLIVLWWSLGRQFVQSTAWIVLTIFIVFFWWLFSYGMDWLVSFDADGKDGNFYYRYELLLNSSDAIKNNLLFGSKDYWTNAMLQNSFQGEGIIDITNSYLRVILESGIVGLFLFLGVWFTALKGLYRVHAPDNTAALLMGICVTMMLMMFICSLVSTIPSYVWLVLAIISGFFKLNHNRF